MSTHAADMPASWLDLGTRAIRRLPHRWVRYLIMLDMALFFFVPPWAYFFFCRWKGRLVGAREFVKLYARTIHFAHAHLTHNTAGVKTGALYVDWDAPPARRTQGVERADWSTKGACGTCTKCCSTTWLPEGKRASCPFLGEKGCTIYGGVYWDYFNCGRYPSEPAQVAYYECPRFVGVFDRPAARPAPARLPLAPAAATAEPELVAAHSESPLPLAAMGVPALASASPSRH